MLRGIDLRTCARSASRVVEMYDGINRFVPRYSVLGRLLYYRLLGTLQYRLELTF